MSSFCGTNCIPDDDEHLLRMYTREAEDQTQEPLVPETQLQEVEVEVGDHVEKEVLTYVAVWMVRKISKDVDLRNCESCACILVAAWSQTIHFTCRFKMSHCIF